MPLKTIITESQVRAPAHYATHDGTKVLSRGELIVGKRDLLVSTKAVIAADTAKEVGAEILRLKLAPMEDKK